MKRSLQHRLTFILGITIVLSGLVSALISLVFAYTEAKEFQDDTLRQIAYLTSLPTSTANIYQRKNPESAQISLKDTESLVSVIHIPGDPRPAWLKKDLAPGLHTIEDDDDRFRIFLQKNPADQITVVIQSTDSRDEIAVNSALRAFAPLIIFLPFMAWLIMRIVRSELTTIKKLANHLDMQPTEQPGQLSDENVPDEIIPFVHAINRLLERVNNLMEQQRNFVADAAHELRSPLTALSLQVQNLQTAGSLESVKGRIQPLRDGIERARKLAEQLLNLAKIQTRTENNVTVDISSLSRKLIAEYLPIAEARNIDLGLEEREPLALSGTTDNFQLILKNGLENALLYTPAGGQVTIRLIQSFNDKAGFEIVDNGLGITASEQKRVFDRFYRLPGTVGGGSGLGLAIALEAATSQGGSVSIQNRCDGTGLIFRYLQQNKETHSAVSNK